MKRDMGKTARILTEIAELDETDFNLLLVALDNGMHDEWDCGLPQGLEMFGVEEIRLAVRAGAVFAASAHKADNN